MSNDGYYYCLNCHSEITPDYNEHCCFCGSAAVAVSGDYSPEEVETAFDLLNKQQQGLVVEVVRCCDCKHSQQNPDINNTCYLTCNLKYGIRGTLDPTDFCSYGKRKGD